MKSIRRGLTLIELQVIIGIIAILAAIVFPVFAQAKDAAKKASCINNVKQICLAWSMYATDYDDTTPVTTYFQNGILYGIWSALVAKNGHYDVSNGIIQPYIKNPPITNCPAATEITSQAGLAYGLNNTIYTEIPGSWKGYPFSLIERPTETILMADSTSASIKYNSATPLECYTADFGTLGVFIGNLADGRHLRQATVGWMDGHAKAIRPSLGAADFPRYFNAFYSSDELNELAKGWILYGPWQGNHNGFPSNPTPHDCYYYHAKKPKE